jgi:hypothetical protein
MRIKKWSVGEIEYLKKNYDRNNKNLLTEKLNKSWKSIKVKAYSIGLDKPNLNYSNWSQEENDFLINCYNKSEKNLIIKNLNNKSWSSIQNKAFTLGLKRNIKHSDLSPLCEQNVIAYYWIGFLMADGHFSKKENIQINLSNKDKDHLLKFSEFVKYTGVLTETKNQVRFSSMDKESFNKIKNKFNITNNKTYEPCKIDNIKNNDLLFSLIIGFIDGDGCIQNNNGRTSLVVKSHSSWIENLHFMFNFLCKNFLKKYKPKIDKAGLAYVGITDIEILKSIKLKTLHLKLPTLNRKWDKIDLNKKSKKEIKIYNKNICFKYFELGKNIKEVMDITTLSHSLVHKNFLEYSMNINKDFKSKRDLFKENRYKIIELLKKGNTVEDILKSIDTSLITISRCKRILKEKDNKRETDRALKGI